MQVEKGILKWMNMFFELHMNAFFQYFREPKTLIYSREAVIIKVLQYDHLVLMLFNIKHSYWLILFLSGKSFCSKYVILPPVFLP